ncbi:MAG TPA: ATP-binding protein [Candidatus Eisenbergiella stercorigallinarum]|uniref:ATP-binding protein n=1 Tax=Candidatus Eisenbergiella stercorigallinarum TaxID=2838557 RepID=A0A9D2R4D8_9FIRM|nr:ATP-binding protein [Candidatus Eisenbergiella stercorigallinarum]
MFKVRNYTSFKEESILDMRATSYVQHPSHVIHVDDRLSLLKTTALYGANASGKSNLISAMFFFEQYIFSQFINKNGNEDFETEEAGIKMKLEPFSLSDSVNEASEFDIIFLHHGKQIQYGFECTSKEVLNEWLFINDKKAFERNGTELSFGSKYQKMLGAYKKLPAERLYIAVLEYFLDEEAKEEVLGDFISFFSKEYNVYSEILFESTVKGLAGMIGLSRKLVRNQSYRKKVEQYLRLIDVGIKRLDVQTETIFDERTGKKKREKVVRTVHDIYDKDGNPVGEKLFSLRQESTGTLRFLAYIQNIIEMISNGGVFIVDEMSARLHPLLTKLIVDIFCSEQNEKAQLIFTTHDISLLNKDQFRRDEVVFVDKNERGESSLYALSDLKVREDATFSKDYLQGKYGAIPIFNYDDILDGE